MSNQRRPWIGPPVLVFTSDFHQLVRGRLKRGVTCTISYDPRRIVPPGEPYRFGSSDMTFAAHLQFHAGGPVLDIPLASRAGEMEQISTTRAGIGPTLKGTFTIPDDTDWITAWITCSAQDGRTWYDSNYSANFIFRFTREDLELRAVEVQSVQGSPLDRLYVCVAADSTIERTTIRYRIVNSGAQASPETEVDLQRTGDHVEEGYVIWETPDIAVPHRAVVAFDIVYFISEQRFKDDNRGRYYLAAEPTAMQAAYLPHSR